MSGWAMELYASLAQGGPVMVVLVAISVWMWVLIFERCMVFWLARRGVVSGIAPQEAPLIDARIKGEKRNLRKNLTTIATLAAMAPVLGLLGTVVGMVDTFDVISAFGTGNAKAMAGGISTALITTQSGLLVGVPGLFMGAALRRMAQRLEDGLDQEAGRLKREGSSCAA